ncbi:MAG: hypothetical protein DRI86_12065 [Bacteroidetes bacterium]|nr:MAG: hypothetical protein DRI86_12065 [Bacteroidota bacterium]
MDLKNIMVNEVASVIEETTNFVTNRLVMESLLKNGKVTLEEANFFNSLAKEVITEAAEDFIPETVSFEEAEVQIDNSAAELEEAAAQATAQAVADEAAKAKALEEATAAQAVADEAAKAKELEEATAAQAVADEAKALEESTALAAEEAAKEAAKEVAEPVELTESELIVNRLIAKMV